jgi:hypothetical protein
VNLQSLQSVTDEGIKGIATLENLKSLTIERCYDVTDASFKLIAKHCQSLESVNLSNNREELLSDASMKLLADSTHVSELDISQEDYESIDERPETAVTDVGVVYMAETRGSHLKTFNFANRFGITLKSYIAVGRYCPHIKISKIDLRLSNAVVTDEDLIGIAETCPLITYLNINTLDNVSHEYHDASLMQLVERCNDITDLYLSNNEHITDSALVKIAECCPRLRLLSLSHNTNITLTSVTRLAENKMLEILKLRDCSLSLSGFSSTRLWQLLPWLQSKGATFSNLLELLQGINLVELLQGIDN